MGAGLGLLLSKGFELVTTMLENKKKVKELQHQKEVDLIQSIERWEELHAKNSGSSWKDEFWTIVFSIPLVLCFIPSTVDIVNQGFQALEQTPEWYRWCVLSLVGASIGIRKITDLFSLGKGSKGTKS